MDTDQQYMKTKYEAVTVRFSMAIRTSVLILRLYAATTAQRRCHILDLTNQHSV
jgi:hypothetical protein